jgi:hypothetical protein
MQQARILTTKQERSLAALGSGCMTQRQVRRVWVLRLASVVLEQNWAPVVFVLGLAAA